MACFIWCTSRETTVADRLGAGELRRVDDDECRELRLGGALLQRYSLGFGRTGSTSCIDPFMLPSLVAMLAVSSAFEGSPSIFTEYLRVRIFVPFEDSHDTKQEAKKRGEMEKLFGLDAR